MANKLISKGSTNAKTAKNFLETHILYMAPYNQNAKGINLCPKATESCAKACLFTAGRGVFNNVRNARTAKANLYVSERQIFSERIAKELSLLNKKAIKKDGVIRVRLNGTTDLDILSIVANRTQVKALTDFSKLEFYDYTKVLGKVKKYAGTNYRLTFSRTELNEAECIEALALGANVAVVFDHKKPLPATYLGRTVIDGDASDDIMFEHSGVILGLKAKGQAKKDTTGFVVR